MNAPFFKYGLFGEEVSLIVAFVIGLAFGFVLERAGFGNARVLAAQFYFRDLRVLKVMFTAIVTAMVGLFLLARVGFVDLSLVYLTPTYVAPQIVGGLILGAGFIIGGYCPGTSCVSAATGRIDGMVYLAGMIGGLLGFAEIYPYIASFATTTALGQVTLPQFLHLPYGALVFAVVLMALGAFVAAEWAEGKVGGKAPDADSLLAPARRFSPVRRFGIGLIFAGAIAAIAGNPYRGPLAQVDPGQLAFDMTNGANGVAPADLAQSLITGRNEFVLVDLREPAAFARYHLPGALSIPLVMIPSAFADRQERYLCYADGDREAAQAVMLLRSRGFAASYALRGGLAAWQSDVLFPKPPAADASVEAQRDFAQRAAIAKFFGGDAQSSAGAEGANPPVLPVITPAPAGSGGAKTVAPKKKKEGC